MGSIKFSVDAVGMQDVIRQLDNASELRGASRRALTAGAEIVLRAAKDLAPVRTGELKRALRVGRRLTTKDTSQVEVGAFSGEAPHAHLVEGGHGGPRPAPPHPFLQPAVEMTEADVIDAIMEELTRSL